MITENAEVKTQRVWGNQETGQSWIDSDRCGGVGQTSSEIGCEPLSAHRDDRKGGNFINQCGQATLGGIITRLIYKTLHEIEVSDNRTAELKQYLKELQELQEQSQQLPEIEEPQ